MNPQQQRERRTAVTQLAANVDIVLEDFARATTTGFQEFAKTSRGYTDDAVKAATTTCDERWADTWQTDKKLADRLHAFEHMTFRERFRWLLLGK
jgi:hypothetical protein